MTISSSVEGSKRGFIEMAVEYDGKRRVLRVSRDGVILWGAPDFKHKPLKMLRRAKSGFRIVRWEPKDGKGR